MKAISLVIFLIVCFFAYNFYSSKKTLTQDEFNDYRAEFRHQIDSIKLTLDTIKTDVRFVRANTDTIKAGQHVIFSNIKATSSNSENTFFAELIEILKK